MVEKGRLKRAVFFCVRDLLNSWLNRISARSIFGHLFLGEGKIFAIYLDK